METRVLLTEEQKMKMEENRRRAIEKRAARLVGKEVSVEVSSGSASSGLRNQFTKTSSFYPKSPKLFPTNIKKTADRYSKSPSYSKPPGLCARPVISFQLISRSRFMVEAPFNQRIVEIFKKMPSRSYDAGSRKWCFGLSDHQCLLDALTPFTSSYQISPLPVCVPQIFRNVSLDKTIPEVDISGISSKLNQALLPFQREGVFFGIHLKGRVLIADDMGLGKTLQALALANYYLSDWPLLILTPSSMKYSWNEAVRVWLPHVPLHHIQVLRSGKDYIDKDLAATICSYDLMSKKIKELVAIKFGVVIFDESHFLKSHQSQRTKSALQIGGQAKRVVLLSGTPALSRPSELYSQLQILESKNKIFNGFQTFGVRYCDGKQTNFGWNFQGATNMTELQLILEEKYMIRRLKSQVLTQLPAKQRQMVVLDPSSVKCDTASMKAKADNMNNEFSKPMEKRGALLTYYSETARAKGKAVCDYLIDLLDSGKKFLCFAHHIQLINEISQCIDSHSIKYIRIDGSVNAEERKKLCDDFQLKDDVRVAVLSITAANSGLTLTAAHLVVFAELFWNPGILTQAEDRAHRIGQRDSVIVQYLVARGTADDYLWPLVQKKLDVLSQAGLSKDNFHDADTTHLTNQRGSIADFFEKLSEEDFQISALDEKQFEEGCEPENKKFRKD